MINEKLSYSFRDTEYSDQTYPSNMHYHDYYEIVAFEEGDIRYICEGTVFYPQYGDIILIPPGKFHMSAINAESTRYKRHVFYLYPSALEPICGNALTEFLNGATNGTLFSFNSNDVKQAHMDILTRLREALETDVTPLREALALSYIIQSLYLLNHKSFQPKNEISTLPENILMIQHYIDESFSTISSVSEIAEHFFYSREYLSRLFRKYFDTTISDYIMKRRIAEAQSLIMQGLPLIDISYQVGFSSLSTFIRAFRTVTSMTPSEYRKMLKSI
jgi:AraC-like DNA-binding protein